MNEVHEVHEAVKELVAVAYKLGMVQGSGAEYFENGRTYGYEELNDSYVSASRRLEDALTAVGAA